MTSAYQTAFAKTQEKVREMSDRGYGHEDFWRIQNAEKFRQTLEESLKTETSAVRERILAEYFSYGPLDTLLADEEITEILVNGPESIWFEKEGLLPVVQQPSLAGGQVAQEVRAGRVHKEVSQGLL